MARTGQEDEYLGEIPTGSLYLSGRRFHMRRVRACSECGEPFESGRNGRKGPYVKRCPACLEKKRVADSQTRSQRLRGERQVASAHGCKICGGEIHGRAVYCKSVACQRARNTAKQRSWTSKPETKKHLSAYRKERKAQM